MINSFPNPPDALLVVLDATGAVQSIDFGIRDIVSSSDMKTYGLCDGNHLANLLVLTILLILNAKFLPN